MYVATKGVFAGELYAAPRELGRRAPTCSAVGTREAIVTDGAFLAGGEHLMLRDYTRAVVYSFPPLDASAR